ncbi:hypothetical protein [Paraflavitalea speifideaquila]|uniref:hypothetical protein n=1 Tax=Paraflavitalea speifideaquila TaxID=3076558 RepID=UPI0028E4E54C|nr:hypothetical protein [Paraflavitalea speifideiaquila]
MLIQRLSIISGIIPIIFFLIFLKRNKESKLWVIFIYVTLSYLTDNLLSELPKPSPVKFYVFSFFTVMEYTFFSLFLYLSMKSKLIKQIIVWAAPLFITLVLYSLFNKNQSNNFDAIPASIESILIIIFCVCFFFEQIRDMEVSFVYSSKTFWIIVAILIYMAATFFLFVSTQYFTQEERKAYWFINYISNIIKNLLLATAFIIPNYKPKSFVDRPYDDELFERPAI